MYQKPKYFVLFMVVAFLFTGGMYGVLPAGEAWGDNSNNYFTLSEENEDGPTILTVTSGQDPDDSLSNNFDNAPGGLKTLRRAIVQARNIDGPVEIRFDIPQTAEEGYDSELGIWKIQIFNTTRTTIFRQLTGNITIDGNTQPGGRDNGPKIFIVGPGGGMKGGLTLGETANQNNNAVIGLGFQNLRTHIFVNSKNNTVRDCWFGLNDEGTGVYLRNNNPEDGSGSAGIDLLPGAENNIIENNVFTGFDGTAATLRGNANTFRDNYVGTQADGTVENSGCTPEHWLGGGGVVVQGKNQSVTDNIIAGLRQEIFHLSQQPDALRVSVEGLTATDGHTIENNKIGIDAELNVVGSCGRGIYLSGDMRGTLIKDNIIYNTRLSAISLNGSMYNNCTLRGNIIRQDNEWPALPDSMKPEEAIQLGPGLPAAFINFNPAMVTSIEGTTVTGTSVEGSPGPHCVIELFLDTDGFVTQALESLAVVTADENGEWEAEIPFELDEGQGIRTTSTTAQYGTIPNMRAGTTTGLSELYRPQGPQVTLTIEIEGEGTTEPVAGNHEFAEGAEVELIAVPSENWQFDKWVVDETEYATSTVLLILESDTTARAYFKESENGDGETLQYGDVDGKNGITVSDAIAVLRHIVGLNVLTGDELERAKVAGEENVSVQDAILILRYIVGLPTESLVGEIY